VSDDLATQLAELEQKLDRKRLAFALGVKPRDLDAIAAGYVPRERVAERIRTLHGAIDDVDLSDPDAVRQLVGVTRFGPLTGRLFVAFVAVDLLIGLVIVVVVLLRT
jgi:hypothetical protein